MQAIYIAQLDDANMVVAVSQLNKKGFVPARNLIELPDFDTSVLGKVYDFDTKTFNTPSTQGGDN